MKSAITLKKYKEASNRINKIRLMNIDDPGWVRQTAPVPRAENHSLAIQASTQGINIQPHHSRDAQVEKRPSRKNLSFSFSFLFMNNAK